jgi:hypothetical protein
VKATDPDFLAVQTAAQVGARAWLKRGVPFDREELEQEAVCIAMKSLPAALRTGDALEPYLCRAVILSLGNAMAQWLSACSVSKHNKPMPSSSNPANLRVPLDFNDHDHGPTPEAHAIDFDSLTRVRAEFERLISEMRGEDQTVMRHMAATGDEPGAATAATGVPLRRAYKAKRQFVLKARASLRLRAVVG